MDEKVKNDEKKVMLVRQTGEGQDGKLKAVGSIDEDGNIETLDPTAANVAKLFDVNTNQPALEAFFTKFMEQSQDPVKTGISEIFIMAESVLNKLIKIDLDPQLLENYRVDPAEELAKMEQQIAVPRFEPMDISKIDTADMERMGIRMEDLEPHLKAMSYGHKSHGLIEMRPEMEPGGMRVTTKGRVSLEEQADGTLKVVPHYYREKCDLDAPFHNVLLDDEAKRNIIETRHAGKAIDLELEPGKMTPCYVSRDKWTNELVAMPVSDFDKRASIKNADLSEGEQLDFYSGRKILLKGYTTRSGYKRDAYISRSTPRRAISSSTTAASTKGAIRSITEGYMPPNVSSRAIPCRKGRVPCSFPSGCSVWSCPKKFTINGWTPSISPKSVKTSKRPTCRDYNFPEARNVRIAG